jgi:hypothetical protein
MCLRAESEGDGALNGSSWGQCPLSGALKLESACGIERQVGSNRDERCVRQRPQLDLNDR